MIRAFTELITDLKRCGINPCFHIMDNKASTVLKKSTATMYIKYQLVSPSIHRDNNAEREIRNFKNPLIVVLCSVDTDFHLQLWYRITQQEQ